MTLVATTVALLAHPFSRVLIYALLALVGSFLTFAVLVIAYALPLAIYRSQGFGMILNVRVRIDSVRNNLSSKASNPGGIHLSRDMVRRLLPELLGFRGNPLIWLDSVLGSRAALLFQVGDHLRHGDGRAAIVLSSTPLLVAAYTDELDCVTLLQFPDELTQEFGLAPRTRLLTVNRYVLGGPLAADLENGPLSYRRYSNFMPIVADFVTDDAEQLRERKRAIREDEWTRTWVLGQQYLERHGTAARDGRPMMCLTPAEIEADGSQMT